MSQISWQKFFPNLANISRKSHPKIGNTHTICDRNYRKKNTHTHTNTHDDTMMKILIEVQKYLSESFRRVRSRKRSTGREEAEQRTNNLL